MRKFKSRGKCKTVLFSCGGGGRNRKGQGRERLGKTLIQTQVVPASDGLKPLQITKQL